MNAEELFEISFSKHRWHQGLSARIGTALANGGYYDAQTGNFDGSKIKQDVMNGAIWNVRGISTRSVRIICEWLEVEGYLQ